MQHQKCSLKLYTNFLIANQNRYSGSELARVSPIDNMHHDAVSRWLSSVSFVPAELWRHVKHLVKPTTGYLVGDDCLLDKKYSRSNQLAKVQYSGNEHRLTNGICLVNLLWTDGEAFVPVDYRIYQKARDHKTKNDHFRELLDRAERRGFSPKYVLIDEWYSSIENFKHIRKKGWHFIGTLQYNRKVSLVKGTYIPVADLGLANKQVRRVWLKEYGHVLVCKLVDAAGDIAYLVTSDLNLTDYETFIIHHQYRWKIEEFHRGIKQTTGIEKCYSVLASSQATHIFAAFTAFLKLERRRLKQHISWYEQKATISRLATAIYLKLANA